jgi:hypothetical protein
MRGCTPGLVHRWSWWSDPPEQEGDPPEYEPEEGEILKHPETGSCYLIQSAKRSSRKARGWWVLMVEGLGVDAADFSDGDHVRSYKKLSHADYQRIAALEAAWRT